MAFKHINKLLCICSVIISFNASASLIGDTVVGHFASHYEPGYYDTRFGTIFIDGIFYDMHFDATEIGPIVAGDADASMVPTRGGLIFDFEESGFSVSGDQVNNQWGPNPVFNGIVITDITPDPAAKISGFTLTGEMFDYDNNLVDFTAERVSFTDDSVFLNFESLTIFDGVITIDLEFTAVPLPPAMWLFGSGLLGLIGVARRKVNA